VDALAANFQQTYGFSATASQLMDYANRNSFAGQASIFSVWNQLASTNSNVADLSDSQKQKQAVASQTPIIDPLKSYANGQNLLFQDSSNNVLGFNLGNDTAYQMTAQQFTNLVVPPSSTSSGQSIFPSYVATLYDNQIGLSAPTPVNNSIFNVSPSTCYDQIPYQYTKLGDASYGLNS